MEKIKINVNWGKEKYIIKLISNWIIPIVISIIILLLLTVSLVGRLLFLRLKYPVNLWLQH